MTTKKVAFTTKPAPAPTTNVPTAEAADAWVSNRDADPNVLKKRLTLDIPADLHRRIKTSCAMRGTKMVEELIVLINAHYK
jgi:hypothetical protein